MTQNPECPNCQRLQAEMEALRAKLAALEAELRRGGRQAAPFSRDEPKPDLRPPGRRPGQGQFRYREAPPEGSIQETEVVPLGGCPECGGPLEGRAWQGQVQVDVPVVEPVARRFVTESGWCPPCGKRVHSRHPVQVSTASGAAGVSVGPRAKALAVEFKHRLGIPYRKVAELFQLAFGLEVTARGLCQANARLAEKAEPVYAERVEVIRGACAVYADETGWRIGVLSAWLGVVTSQRVTVYVIDKRRSHEGVVEVLGQEFQGVLTSDCFLAYDHRALAQWLKQKCFVHLLRELGKLAREKGGGAVRFPRELTGLLREALALRVEREKLEATVFATRVRELEERLDGLIAEGRRFTDPDNARLYKRLRKQRPHLLRFLYHEEVEATNNRAERALRPAVIVRKTGGCNKTMRGAHTHAILASLLQTLKQQDKLALDYLTVLLTAPAEPPKLLTAPVCDTS